jgi:Carbohydrate-selective porin, OprB family/S-layer homology domain
MPLFIPPIAQITAVSQLADVQPTDWAFQALQSLVERYGCIVGYPDRSFRGNRGMTRSEFAAGLNACNDRINEQIGAIDAVKKEDLQTLQRLQTDFATELATLKGRVEQLETATGRLEKQQFSTTTKLTGQAIFAVNAGGFGGVGEASPRENRIIAPRGATVTQDQPNATSLYRVSLDLNTSFTGQDLLKLRLVSASPGIGDNAAGYLEPNLGSVLDFAIPGRQEVSIARAYYTFSPVRDLSVTLGPQMVAPDFIDKNRYANTSFRDFSTSALVNNFILLPRPGGAGAAIDWHPNKGPFSLRSVYIASSGSTSLPENQQFFGGGRPQDIRLFPASGGGATGGLFGDPYTGIVELEYAPTKAFSLRLQYSGGELLNSQYKVFGANADLALSPKVGLFARYGYGSYPDTILGDIKPQYWSAGIAFQDLFRSSDLAGIGIAQPFILSAIGNATQTNFEAFYNIPVSKRFRLTPIVQVISNAGNQRSNGAIVTGTLRAVLSF